MRRLQSIVLCSEPAYTRRVGSLFRGLGWRLTGETPVSARLTQRERIREMCRWLRCDLASRARIPLREVRQMRIWGDRWIRRGLRGGLAWRIDTLLHDVRQMASRVNGWIRRRVDWL